MNTEKLSISLPKAMKCFLLDYQKAHALHSRSEVIREAFDQIVF